MGIFDKVTKTAATIGKSALNSAAKVGSSIGVSAQDHSDLAALKMQVNVIDQELDASYAIIGRKFVDYVAATQEMPGIDVADILKLIEPKLEQKMELEKQIVALEKKIKDTGVLREKKMAEETFLAEKAKLDKALAMDVISQDEYDYKLAIAQTKRDNFEQVRKVEQQYEMKLITKEERDAKLERLMKSGF